MGYPQTQVPNTRHSVFYSHTIMVNGLVIGSFERISMRATRTAERIREVLFSRGPQTVEIVWGGTDISVDLTRVELYTASMMEAFGFEIFTIEDFNQPIDIVEMQRASANAGEGLRTITYQDCVATSWGKDIDTGTARMVETMTFEVRTVVGERSS